MATELISVASGAANSEDIAVGAGETVTLCLKYGDGSKLPARAAATISMKDDDSHYVTIGHLTAKEPSMVLAAPGTFRVSRLANGVSCGVFRS